jgi:hypothetical protein
VKHFIELKLPNFIQLLELPCFTSPGVVFRKGNGIGIHLNCEFDIRKLPKLYSKKDFELFIKRLAPPKESNDFNISYENHLSFFNLHFIKDIYFLIIISLRMESGLK